MKKVISLLLVLSMLCAGSALASEWQPGKPNEGLPEVDLTEKLGYMMFSPNSVLTVELACQRLYVYLPRTDVKAGEGSLHVYGVAGEIWKTPMASEAVALRPMSADEMTLLHWEDGVCFEIRLGISLPLNEACHVEFDENCIVTQDGGIGNPSIIGAQEWPVQVSGDYGVGGLQYLRDGETVLAPTVDDTIRFDLTLGGDAVIASIYSPDASVAFDLGAYEASGEVIGQVVGDAPSWGVVFLDANGAQVGFVALD